MRHRIKKTYSVQKDTIRHANDMSDSELSTDKQQPNTTKSHLLHSDKSIKEHTHTHRRCSLNTLFLEARSRRLPSQGRAANPRRNSGPSAKKVFTGAAQAYFYKSKIGNKLGYVYSMFSKLNTIPLVLSSLALLVVLGFMISPVGVSSGEEKAYALDGDSSNNEQVNEPVPYTVPPDDGVSLTINTSLPENETIEKEVSGSGAKYITVDFTVGAHNIDDYKVYVQADSTTLTGSSYNDKINTINGPTTAGEMDSATKQWGYAVVEGANADTSTMTFSTIQTGVSVPAKTVTGVDGGKIVNHTQPYTLAFAANLDGAKADHYRSDITLSVAAGAEEVNNIGFGADIHGVGSYRIYNMQDMTDSFCSLMPVGAEGSLRDVRDDKIYWVAKLDDKACWMTQNLALDLYFEGSNVTLTPEDSDVDKNWTSSSGESSLAFGTDNSNIKFYNQNNYVYYSFSSSNNCSLIEQGLIGCLNKGWKDISGLNPSNNPNFYSDNDGQIIVGNEYDAHFLAGNYYSWGAATAGTGTGTATGKNASNSICPRGWRLPYGGADTGITGSFSELDLTVGNISKPPYYFVPSGFLSYYNSNRLYNAGTDGRYWSSTAQSTAKTYLLDFTYSNLNFISTGNERSNGLSVRCVAR